MKNKVIIIAEAGVNHNGDYELAKKLILEASNAGADYVKFQTFKADKLVSKDAQKADYQKSNFNEGGDTQYEMLKKLEMPEAWHYELIKYANNCGIKFLSTGFDEDSIDFLDSLKIDLFKIPSGEITNKPYLEHIAKKGKPVVISTGMSNLNEIKDAIDIFEKHQISKNDITVLHCNTEYPTPMQDVNLLAMNTIQRKFEVNVGYSDHTLGIEVPIAAVALGAVLIEKHFTLDRNMNGPDHIASLTPDELKQMITSIRNIELAISGNGVKELSKSELKNLAIVRKSIHTKRLILKGEIIKKDDLIMTRPGDGISPMQIHYFINKIANKDLQKGQKLSINDIIS
jgi:N-acetylneuraminate synthase/N,N'-diacetyllegionaminate synthase